MSFLMDITTPHLLFTDGSSLGNPGPGGWGAILVKHRRDVIELGARKIPTTNNEMELQALLSGLQALAHEKGDLTVVLDSTYVMNGATKWVYGWKKNGWLTTAKASVEHRNLWEEVDEYIAKRKVTDAVHFHHVRGHVGVSGNERCDEIAVGFAEGKRPELFHGMLSDYAVDILNIDVDDEAMKRRNADRTRSRKAAYSYLSMVDGVILRHTTWSDCEDRVKGTSGAKYKKAVTKEEEIAIVREWKDRQSPRT